MAVKSFSIKIGADSSDFNKGLRQADKQIKNTEKAGKALQESLKLKWDSKTFQSAQKMAQQAVDLTNQKVKALKDQLAYLEKTGGIDTDNYYELQTKLAQAELKAKDLNDELNKINNLKFTNISQNVTNLGSKISAMAKSLSAVSVASAGALAGIFKLSKSAIQNASDIDTLSVQYEVSSEEIQKWNYIALQSDVASEQLYKSMRKVRKAVSEISAGEITNAGKAIGELLGGGQISSNASQGFEQIVNALSEMEDKTMQSYYANEIFGTELANQLIPLLSKGADAINELSEEFEDLGYMSNEQVSQLNKFNNEFKKIKTQLTNVSYQLAVALMPVIQSFVNLLENKIYPTIRRIADWFAKLDDSTKNWMVTVLGITAVLSPALLILGKMVSSVGSLIGLLPKLSSLLSLLAAHPIIAIIGVIAALMTALYIKNEDFRNSVNRLFNSLSRSLMPVLQHAAKIIGDLLEMMQPLIDLLSNVLIQRMTIVADILDSIVGYIEAAVNFITRLEDKVAGYLGKGKWWGFESQKTASTSDYLNTPNIDYSYNTNNNSSSSMVDTSTTINNININAEGASAEDLYELISRKLAVKIQSRG